LEFILIFSDSLRENEKEREQEKNVKVNTFSYSLSVKTEIGYCDNFKKKLFLERHPMEPFRKITDPLLRHPLKISVEHLH
jgi:hypothetical protein